MRLDFFEEAECLLAQCDHDEDDHPSDQSYEERILDSGRALIRI